MNKVVAIITLILSLGAINYSIYDRESHINNGKLVLIELAPVDPRSLMQGDYMALNFGLATKIRQANVKAIREATLATEITDESASMPPRNLTRAIDAQVVVDIDANNVASFSRLHQGIKIAENQMLLNYRIRDQRVVFATNAFYFEEGTAELYEKSKYGGFRVNAAGELLLVEMYDEKFDLIGKNTP